MKFVRNAVVLLLAVLLAGPFVFPFFDPWSGINCRNQSINIISGKARYERYIWFVKVSSRDEETSLSAIIKTHESNEDAWRLVNRFGLWQTNSPHYMYHGAFHQIGLFEAFADARKWSAEKKREVALAMTKIWQTDDNYYSVNEYLQEQYEAKLKK